MRNFVRLDVPALKLFLITVALTPKKNAGTEEKYQFWVHYNGCRNSRVISSPATPAAESNFRRPTPARAAAVLDCRDHYYNRTGGALTPSFISISSFFPVNFSCESFEECGGAFDFRRSSSMINFSFFSSWFWEFQWISFFFKLMACGRETAKTRPRIFFYCL